MRYIYKFILVTNDTNTIMKEELPKKYETPDWLWVYGNIGLTEEHIKRLNNAINLLESLNEHTDAKYLKEIKDKLLADAPMQEKKATPRREYCNKEYNEALKRAIRRLKP